jgi:hypothetical protein
MHQDRGDRDRDRAEDEQPAPREVIDDQAGKDDSEAAADAEDSRDQADPDADLLARELVADDPEAQRKDRRAEALKGSESRGRRGLER